MATYIESDGGLSLGGNGGYGYPYPYPPMYGYGNNGNGFFGGDIWAILLLAMIFGGGWGGMGFGGFGGGLGYDFPWILNGQNGINNNTNAGFRDAAINSGIDTLQTTVANGFANAEVSRCNSLTSLLQALNGLGTQFQSCCCDNKLGIADLKYTVATENCADRQALNNGVRDIIANQTAGIQSILDKLCDQELQAERRDNANLRSELMYARGQASQIEQTAAIRAGQNQTMTALVNELRSCPIPAQPVYGNTPIFSCNRNNGCGCGCNGVGVQ